MKKTLLATALIIAMGASMASANLIMKIDTANDIFYFEGSDSGNFVLESGAYQAIFSSSRKYTMDDDFLTHECFVESIFTSNTSMPNNEGMQFSLLNPEPFGDITSLTGKGVSGAQSYATMVSADQAAMESMIGDTFTLVKGSGFSDIQVQAVPEPATAGLLSISVGALWLIRRLKKAANYYLT